MFKETKDRPFVTKSNNGNTTDSDGTMRIIHNFDGLGLLMKIENNYYFPSSANNHRPEVGKSE
jgi:hypothetical protein